MPMVYVNNLSDEEIMTFLNIVCDPFDSPRSPFDATVNQIRYRSPRNNRLSLYGLFVELVKELENRGHDVKRHWVTGDKNNIETYGVY